MTIEDPTSAETGQEDGADGVNALGDEWSEEDSVDTLGSQSTEPPMQFSLLALMLGITLLGFLLGLGRISPVVTALIVFVGSLLGGVVAGTIWIATHFGQASQGTVRWFGSLGRLLPLLLFCLVAGWLLAVFGSALRSP